MHVWPHLRLLEAIGFRMLVSDVSCLQNYSQSGEGKGRKPFCGRQRGQSFASMTIPQLGQQIITPWLIKTLDLSAAVRSQQLSTNKGKFHPARPVPEEPLRALQGAESSRPELAPCSLYALPVVRS